MDEKPDEGKEPPPPSPCKKYAIRTGAAVFVLFFLYQTVVTLLIVSSARDSHPELFRSFDPAFNTIANAVMAGVLGLLTSLMFYIICINRKPRRVEVEPVHLPLKGASPDFALFGVCGLIAFLVFLAGLLEGVDPAYFLHLSPILGTIFAPLIALAFVSGRRGVYEASRRLVILPTLLGVAMTAIAAITILANLGIPDLTASHIGGVAATAVVPLVFGPTLSAVFLLIGASEPHQ